MAVWETAGTSADAAPALRDFPEIWRAADKIVYSRTLEEPTTARTRIERDFEFESVLKLKARAERDLLVGGSELAGEAIEGGLVDELHLFVVPVLVGGGTPALPDGVRADLDLLDERRFGNGMVQLRYRFV